MTISLNEIAYDLMEVYRQTFKDNDEVDIRQIKYWVNTERAYLINKMIERNPNAIIDEGFIQELNPNGTGIKTEVVDATNILGINSSTYICRTDIDIPNVIDIFNKNGGFTRIAPANRLSQKYPLVSMETAFVSGNGRFNSRQIYAYRDGKRICFLSKSIDIYKMLEYVSIKGIFQNPKEVSLLNSSTYTDDMDYPISISMVEDIKKQLFYKEFKFSLTQPKEALDVVEDTDAKQIPAES